IVLIRKTGSGKSAAGNTILQREAFLCKISSKSITRECQKAVGDVNGRQVAVIDTPGLFNTVASEEEVLKEIGKCISLSAPGPHVFLLVLELGRFTEEEKKTVERIKEIFGEKAEEYIIVLFTHGDKLHGKPIEEFISDGDDDLKIFVDECGGRYHVFNNHDSKNLRQVTELPDKINRMVESHDGRFYTNEMFQEAEAAIRKEQERLMMVAGNRSLTRQHRAEGWRGGNTGAPVHCKAPQAGREPQTHRRAGPGPTHCTTASPLEEKQCHENTGA
uniref:AIG1-type G domain-containing protein n=1 Tax=Scleropages formosus TaxID=113540 RepID=A0A8C9RA69_SCLFO